MALDLSSLCTSGLQFARDRAPCCFLSTSLITSVVELLNSLTLASEAEGVSKARRRAGEMCTGKRREN
ncbi:hypothetical protein Syun_011570 [Stephania yunnanensis]|uniref:Uncharacterized protein n=1 Tax=Stephania yunnanensis TaxID=152371 RepID=A0AAP0K003_9MAGN